MDFPQPPEDDPSKRLSSIKSILNPTGAPGDSEHNRDAPRSSFQSPGNTTSENDATAKAERRAALQREAEYMRALLAAKERELAEL
jgi:hypothetical protein